MSRALRATLVCLLCAAPAAAELRRVEAEGLAPAAAETGSGALRESALRAGVSTAVDQVALALLDEAARRPARFGPEELAAVLGDSPSDYAARFKILSDEGLRPAAGERPAIYAVRVEVMVEADRVRARLVEAGLLAAETARAPETRQLQVVLEPLASHRALAHARRVLGERGGAKRAVPVELSAGRAVLAVDTPLSPEALADAVAGSDTDGFRIDVVAVDATGVTLHVVAPGATAESETSPPPAPE